jgi:integrase
VPLAGDKAVALQMLAELVRRGERGEAGLNDSVVAARLVPLADHLNDFTAYLRSKPVRPEEEHIRQVRNQIETVAEACGFATLADLDAQAVRTYLAHRRDLPKKEGGISAQTSNNFVASLNNFARWLITGRKPRLRENPFAELGRSNVALDRRHDRRDLLPEELGRLLEVTRASVRVFRGLAGEDRYWLYLTAVSTGLRSDELSALVPENFACSGELPTVTLPTKLTKNKKPTTQPLPVDVARGLAHYLTTKPAGQSIWGRTWHAHAAQMIAKDEKEAGIPYVVAGPNGPLYADFHALRHTFITAIVNSGASLTEAMTLARHSDPKLTYRRYAHTTAEQLGRIVEKLPVPRTGLPAKDEPPPIAGRVGRTRR